MTDYLKNRYLELCRYIKLRPHLGWSVFSFFFLLFMLLIVRWSGSSATPYITVNETMEMLELRMAEQQSISEIEESDEAEPVVEDIPEEKPLCFGVDSPEYNDLGDTATPPKPLFSRLPRYPDSMRKAGVEGVVAIELGISENGEVLYGKIVKSLGMDFDIVVIEWAKGIKFYPARTKERIPMKCRIILPVRFKLEG